MSKRKIKICVISDTHIGSYGCHAEELNDYLKSIDPQILILNGDIFDAWNFSKKNFKTEHIKLIRTILKFIKDEKQVYLITGNHDDFLRDFEDVSLINFHKLDKLVLDIDGKKYWFFHGDVFDISMSGRAGKLVSKIGGKAYDLIIYFNKLINKILTFFGKPPYSLSKRIKDSVKSALIYINDFEQISCEHAVKQGYDYVVNGHIHHPSIKKFSNDFGSVTYMNSGDWIENLTSLEYSNGVWTIYKHKIGEKKN